MKKQLFLILLLLLGACHLNAQKFTVSADKTHLTLGDVVHLSYSLEGGEGTSFEPPAFTGFRIMSGPNVSNEYSGYNRITTHHLKIEYVIQAMEKGNHTLASAHIVSGTKKLTSNTLSFTVSGNTTGGANPGSASSTDFLFMKAVANKTSVVQGEAVAVSYKLYVAQNVMMTSPTITKMPTFTGFWSEEVKSTIHMAPTEETYKGKVWLVYLQRKLILFPQKTGELTVDPLEIECTGQAPAQDPYSDNNFGGFYGIEPFHKVISSDAVKIHVSALPDKGKPASFTGMVGNAAIAATTDRKTVKANQPVTYHLTIGGEGNLSLQQPPKLTMPEGIEVYDPKTTDKFDRSGDNLSGTRTFDYTLMPHKEGTFELPRITFSYYDPAKKSYFESQTLPISLQVEKNDNPVSNDNDTVSTSKKKPVSPMEFLKWAVLLVGSGLLLLAVIMFVRKKEKPQTGADPEENPFADLDHDWYLAEAEKLAKHDPQNEFYTVLLNALYKYMEEYLSIPFAHISHESIETGLRSKNLDPALITNYLNLISEFEMINYAPGGDTSGKEKAMQRAKEAIRQIGKG